MKLKAFVVPVLLASSLLANGQAQAEHKLTPEQLIKARQSASQLNPPVDFDALIKEADRLGVECTGDLTRKARGIICGQKVENAQIQERIDKKQAENTRIKADTEATKARIRVTKADTEATEQKTLEMVKDLQDFVNKK
jgi:hypothetical protein